MTTNVLLLKVKNILQKGHSAVIETSAISTLQIIELARVVGPRQTLTIKNAYTITEEHLNEIATAAGGGNIIFDFTR